MKKLLIILIAAIVVTSGLHFLNKVILAKPNPQQKLVSLRVYPGPGPAASLFQIAKQKGFFSKVGLDVKLQNYDTGLQSIPALQEDKLDVAHPAEFAFVTQSFNPKNNNLRIIGSVVRWSGIQLVARKDHGISKPADIIGKKIGLALNTQSEFALADFLTLNQISLNQVTLVDMQSREDHVTAFTKGDVDAIVDINQYAYQSAQNLKDNAVTWWLQQDFPSIPLLVTTKEKLKSHPEQYEKLLQGLDQAIEYTTSHPEEIKKTAHSVYGFENNFLDYYLPHIKLEMSLPQSLLLVMENEARWLIDKKLVSATKVPNYLEFMYPNTMEKVKPESVTIIR